MKKDRNSFFSQYGEYGYNTNPMINNNIPNTNGYNYNNYTNYNYNQDIESRINKLEREINRLDSRLSKLESNSIKTETSSTDYNFANSMYMV